MLKMNISVIKTKYLFFAFVLLLSLITLSLMDILNAKVDAAQVQTRSIQMSNSTVGQTNVQYTIKFNVATTSTSPTVKGILIDMCSNSPIVGVACTAPTNFNWTTGVPAVTAGSTIGANNLSSWTAAKPANNTFTLTSATGVTTTAGDTVTIVLSGVTNSSQLGTFYGRIITFSDTAAVSSYNSGNGIDWPGYVDYGGVALSTTNNLIISAKVQEQLTFCVYTSGTNCANGTMSAINLPTDPDAALSPTTTEINNTPRFSLSSNALGGVTVKMKGFNPANPAGPAYSTLTSGAFTITPYGNGNGICTANNGTSSVEQFGMKISPAAGITAATPYACAAGQYGWDSTGNVNADNVTSPYGDMVATTSGPQEEAQSTIEFAAKSALTTEAGLYTIGLNFIATGTY